MSLWTILALSPLVWSTLALSSSCLPTQTLVTIDGNEYCVDPSAIVDNTDATNGVACGFAAVSGSIGYSCTCKARYTLFVLGAIADPSPEGGILMEFTDDATPAAPGGGFSSFGLPSDGTADSIQASRMVVAGGGEGNWNGGNAGLPGSSAGTSIVMGGGGGTQYGPGLGATQGPSPYFPAATTNGQDGSGFTGGNGGKYSSMFSTKSSANL
ncbi:hypothetical protein MNV49_000848 [Pseudohyphozyma bogoriensis]|nr:hypothetical protein MNV49_000848 [Pseudohyphozyma bogoriensis]